MSANEDFDFISRTLTDVGAISSADFDSSFKSRLEKFLLAFFIYLKVANRKESFDKSTFFGFLRFVLN